MPNKPTSLLDDLLMVKLLTVCPSPSNMPVYPVVFELATGVKPALEFHVDVPVATISAPKTKFPVKLAVAATPCRVIVLGAVVASAAKPNVVITV